ncbi:MAG: tyrosine-protein phosphatase [Clostridia bacterium]|nr:tyrosine-protein phosphatase [Clostridia bacterium]
MRALTIKRKKSIVSDHVPALVYIEDAAGSVLINNVPCRNLGKIKNGEEKTFQISNDDLRVFVIAENSLYPNSCDDFFPIPKGTEDLYATGNFFYNPENDTVFLFDDYSLEAVMARRARRISIAMLSLCLALCLILVSFATLHDRGGSFSGNNTQNTTNNNPSIAVIPIKDEVMLVHPLVAEYESADNSLSLEQLRAKFSVSGRLDYCLPVTLSFRSENLSDDSKIVSCVYEIADNGDFNGAKVYSYAYECDSIDVYYLKTGTLYYYRITVGFSNGVTSTVQDTFKTSATPRILRIADTVNLRDFGGRKTVDGKTVKQDLLFRGGEIDGAVQPTYMLTQQGKSVMLNQLKIRTDLDLRSPDDRVEGEYILGSSVKHVYFGAQMYSNVFTADGKKAIRNLFSELADESNYPVYLHCTYGFDRTGTACFILGALLGVDREDLIKDYYLSTLYITPENFLSFDNFVKDFNAIKGNSFKEKAENFLLSTGVTEREIQSIRSIFLAD